MESRNYIIILYDFYNILFSDKQKLYFEEYYFNNLSLGEISDNYSLSRNAIHKIISFILFSPCKNHIKKKKSIHTDTPVYYI